MPYSIGTEEGKGTLILASKDYFFQYTVQDDVNNYEYMYYYLSVCRGEIQDHPDTGS